MISPNIVIPSSNLFESISITIPPCDLSIQSGIKEGSIDDRDSDFAAIPLFSVLHAEVWNGFR